ncbi:MAG: hypothetical protein GX220_05285 [Treponema sp.]|nr:hypothetical protein [Treponema sp.]
MYLLNTKENIINIEIHNKTIDKENEILILNTKDNIGTFIEQNIEPIIFPLDNIKINTFLQYLRKPHKMYKISDNFSFSSKNFHNFFSESCYQLKINNSTFLFGNINDLGNRQYFFNTNTSELYSIESDLYTFIETSPRFWVEPYIFKDNLSYQSIDITRMPDNAKVVLEIEDIIIYKVNDKYYIKSKDENYNYTKEISKWTYERILNNIK